MGSCTSKPNIEPQVLNRRRRLSINQSHESASLSLKNDKFAELNGNNRDLSNSITSNCQVRGTSGRRRASIFGAPALEIQREFEDKNTSVHGAALSNNDFHFDGVGFACKKGLKPESPNQDDFFIMRTESWDLYGVFDGHGPMGHDVSNFVASQLPSRLVSHPDFLQNPRSAFISVFEQVHKSLCNQPIIDCSMSGCTATIVLHDLSNKPDNGLHGKLWVAHVGDSKAAIISRYPNQSSSIDHFDEIDRVPHSNLYVKTLTREHKPTLPSEQSRIEACGGEVHQLPGDIPHRVFIKGESFPGLAMSRALGDTVGQRIGVTFLPEVTERLLTVSDEAVIVCTDGVWEFISNTEAASIILNNDSPNSLKSLTRSSVDQVQSLQFAVENLVKESWRRWIEAEDGIVVDDITALVVRPNCVPAAVDRATALAYPSISANPADSGTASSPLDTDKNNNTLTTYQVQQQTHYLQLSSDSSNKNVNHISRNPSCRDAIRGSAMQDHQSDYDVQYDEISESPETSSPAFRWTNINHNVGTVRHLGS